jgi:DNA-binding XRE family transcriptional regulator
MNAKRRKRAIVCNALDLGGVRYAVLPLPVLSRICAAAGVACEQAPVAAAALHEPPDEGALSARLVERRRACGLSQAELARRAGVRIETLNRIERGRTTPDFATIRKLVNAMNRAEALRE